MLLIFAQLQSPILGGITLLIAGFFQSLCIVPMSVVILRVSDPAFRGRVMGVRMLAIYSLPIGLMELSPILGDGLLDQAAATWA